MGIDSEDFPSFSRNEPDPLLLDALVVNDEEDKLLSSKPRTQRESVISWFNVNPIPSSNGNDSW